MCLRGQATVDVSESTSAATWAPLASQSKLPLQTPQGTTAAPEQRPQDPAPPSLHLLTAEILFNNAPP